MRPFTPWRRPRRRSKAAGVAQSGRIVAALAALAFALSCLGARPLEPLPAGGIHVLFVGNSLTYVNDLPDLVAALGASVGDTIRVSAAVGPDLALIDHLNGASSALDQIRLGGWQFVVLQEGPSSLPANRDSLTLWTRLFDPYIRGVGAKPALLMVCHSAPTSRRW